MRKSGTTIDIHRFHTLDHVASYVGLVPGEHSTGEEQTITGISRRRNPQLRALLIECAWVAVRTDPALLMAFSKLSTWMPKNKAIIRIARKLLNRIRFVLNNQKPYQPCIVQSIFRTISGAAALTLTKGGQFSGGKNRGQING